jgi:hypothetical protein
MTVSAKASRLPDGALVAWAQSKPPSGAAASATGSLAQQEAVMWKAVLVGVSAITIAGSSIVYVGNGFSQEDRFAPSVGGLKPLDR